LIRSIGSSRWKRSTDPSETLAAAHARDNGKYQRDMAHNAVLSNQG
jgi:hypothetical protein